jgi:hypothetical protein
MQDRCLVCAERATGSETILDAPDGTLGDVGYVDISVCLQTVLVSVQHRCTVYAKRTIGSEIILDAFDGTPW